MRAATLRPDQQTADSSAIRAVSLQKRYGEVHAVRGVSFEVQSAEIFGFLGRNGSGKTTTVRMLTTLTRPTAGAAYVGGVDVLADPAGVRALVVVARHVVDVT